MILCQDEFKPNVTCTIPFTVVKLKQAAYFTCMSLKALKSTLNSVIASQQHELNGSTYEFSKHENLNILGHHSFTLIQSHVYLL